MGEFSGKVPRDAAGLVIARQLGQGYTSNRSEQRFVRVGQIDVPKVVNVVAASPDQVAKIAGVARATEKVPPIPPIEPGKPRTPEESYNYQLMKEAAADLQGRREEDSESGLTRLFGNVPLAEAKIVGLAETHNPKNHAYTAVLVSSLAQDGGIFLVEGIERGQPASRRSRFRRSFPVSGNVEVEGWDNMRAHRRAKKREYEVNQARNALHQLPETASWEELQHLLENEAAARAAYDQAVIPDRAPSLRGAITDAHDRTEGVVFINAGKHHFTQDAQLIEALDQYPFCIVRPVPGS